MASDEQDRPPVETPGRSDNAPAAALALAAMPEVMADSLGEYLQAWWRRIKGGESGVLPILGGLVAHHRHLPAQDSEFLSAGNIVNLLIQAAVFILLALAEIFALLLSEIDLSIGFVAGVGGIIIAELVAARHWPWWAAIIVGLLAHRGDRAPPGHAHHPARAAVVRGDPGRPARLAGRDDLAGRHRQGRVGGVVRINEQRHLQPGQRQHEPAGRVGILIVVVIALFAAVTVSRRCRRRQQGLSAPPPASPSSTSLVVPVVGVALVVVCNVNRGALVPLRGVPWVVPFVLAVSWPGRCCSPRPAPGATSTPSAATPRPPAGPASAWPGSGPSASCCAASPPASPAWSTSPAWGPWPPTSTAARSSSTPWPPPSSAGPACSAAGQAVHALLGGIVIAAVYNGLGLLGVSAAGQDVVTALVLLAAVTVDSLVRRRSRT